VVALALMGCTAEEPEKTHDRSAGAKWKRCYTGRCYLSEP
jgi:hypothetical protein